MNWKSAFPTGSAIVGGVVGAVTGHAVNGESVVVLGGSLAGIGVVTIFLYALRIEFPRIVPERAGRRVLGAATVAVLVVLYRIAVDTTPPLGRVPLLIAYLSLVVYGLSVVSDLAWGAVIRLRNHRSER